MLLHFLANNLSHIVPNLIYTRRIVHLQLHVRQVSAKVVEAIVDLLDFILDVILLVEEFDHCHFSSEVEQLLDRYFNFVQASAQLVLIFEVVHTELVKDVVVYFEVILHLLLVLSQSVQNVDFFCQVRVLEANEFCLDVLGYPNHWHELVIVKSLLRAYLADELVGHLVIELDFGLPVFFAYLFVWREYAEFFIYLVKILILKNHRHLDHERLLNNLGSLHLTELGRDGLTEHGGLLGHGVIFVLVQGWFLVFFTATCAAVAPTETASSTTRGFWGASGRTLRLLETLADGARGDTTRRWRGQRSVWTHFFEGIACLAEGIFSHPPQRLVELVHGAALFH